MVSDLNFTILIINASSCNIYVLSYVLGFCVSVCMCRCRCVFVVFMLSGTFKGIPRWHFFEQSARKGSAPPRLCVQGGECLCGVGLSEKSWLVKFVFCSLYTSSQLRDKTDKSTPPLSPPHLPLLESPFIFLLCWVSSLSPSSLPLPFTILC